MKNYARLLSSLIVGIIILNTVPAKAEVSLAEFESHRLYLKLEVAAQSVTVNDSGLVEVQAGWNLLYLNGQATKISLAINGVAANLRAVPLTDTASLRDELRKDLPPLDVAGEPLLVLFESPGAGPASFRLSYAAEFSQDVSNIRFSNELVGAEVTGTVSEQGAYLSSAAYYYPQGDEQLCRYQLTADLPPDWNAVSDGNRTSEEIKGDRKLVTYTNPFAADGLTFMAAPFVVRASVVDGVDIACYFFEADTGLAEGYLSAVADYLTMYTELVGPYPYDQFTVVENFFPTGYGMPAWTLLGQQVLRLPFIKSTSLGHEVLHNWWGNTVYVDYSRGNWCEAATVYGADYRYKLKQSPAAAQAYRKDILKQYLSYINDGNDFPIREFKSRTSPGTRTIGYNKAMMVFHMIEEEIGTAAFFDAWRLVFEKYQTKKISWEEWVAAFEETSGQELTHILPQWIDQAGAPVLALNMTAASSGKDPNEITFEVVENSGQTYRLNLPVRFTGGDVSFDTTVLVTSPATMFTLSVPAGVSTIELDPDYHLFRKLYAEEVEPIVSAVMGMPQKRFIATDENQLFLTFGENLSGDSIVIETYAALKTDMPDCAPILLNPVELPEYLSGRVVIGPDSLVVDGTSYPKADHTAILTGDRLPGSGRFMVVITDDFESLPRLGQLVPHYGKYSYLVFEGARNVGKGQWQADRSPLRRQL